MPVAAGPSPPCPLLHRQAPLHGEGSKPLGPLGLQQTEGLKQLTSMGSLVLCCGDGTVMNSTNLGLLRHGVSIWIDVPLEMAANDVLMLSVDVMTDWNSSIANLIY
ncbi:hypothetical protein BS78_08G132400 [Paspalum vaginatum]|nr:hypothetical protein BS78_08G132400 [Paspalum vaginatum]